MQARIIAYLISAILRSLTVDQVRTFVDAGIDTVENQVTDETVLEAFAFLRRVMNIPDDIGGDED